MIDLQGRLDRTYVVRFSLSDKPLRANLAERWPTDAADNLERLKDTGQPYDRHVMHCRNCGGKSLRYAIAENGPDQIRNGPR